MVKKTLYVSISGHGFGHIGQMAPILNKLALEYGRHIDFVIQCEAQESFLTKTFHFDFRHIAKPADIGMLMTNALDVQPQQSHRAYKDMHERWAKELLLKSREIDRLRPDLVVSNVSYLTLAAASHLALPSLGLCSLNWADIYHECCKTLPGADGISQHIKAQYQKADHFLVPTPGMPMNDLNNRITIGPLARLGNRYPDFRRRLGLPETPRLVMISMGGIPHALNSQQWPAIDDVIWVDTSNSEVERDDIIPLNRIDLPFVDVLSHCDLLLCKPGYGLFAEATCNGVPVLYMKRELWPEEPCLVDWIKQNNLSAEMDRDAFYSGNFAKPVTEMLDRIQAHEVHPAAPSGVGQACGYILEGLGLF